MKNKNWRKYKYSKKNFLYTKNNFNLKKSIVQ